MVGGGVKGKIVQDSKDRDGIKIILTCNLSLIT